MGIAEQHAATSAAGLALGGLHPVVAVYATFLNRAFDQVLLDVAMHKLPVTFVLDRAGITGPDGPSHYGIWDMSVFGVVPGLRIAAPRDAATLREELREAVAIDDGPTIVRFPTGSVAADLPALRRVGPRRRAAPRRRARTCCWSRSARSPTSGVEVADAARRAGLRRDRGRPALGAPGAGRAGRPGRASTASWSPSRTASAPAASATRSARRCATPASACRCATSGVPAGLAPARHPRARSSPTSGLTAQDVARDVTGWISGLDGDTPSWTAVRLPATRHRAASN